MSPAPVMRWTSSNPSSRVSAHCTLYLYPTHASVYHVVVEQAMSNTAVHAGGQFQDWMRVLPISCLPIMVPAAVSNSGTLILQPDEQDSEVLKQMIAHAKPLATIFNLEVVFTVDRGASAAASKAIDSIGTMTQLRGLTMRNMSLPEVPATLTALTNLRLDNSYTRSPRAKLTTDISAFIGLQVSLLHTTCS